MLSKEERKAIERIEDFLSTNIIISISNDDTANSEELKAFISKNEYLAIEFISAMFLKYSQEIEELNRKVKIKEADIDIFMKKLNKAWIYKIKAKIEEYKEKCKNCNFKGKICKEFTKNYNCVIAVCLNEFYSLLEKE